MGVKVLLSSNNSKVWNLVFTNLARGSACWDHASN